MADQADAAPPPKQKRALLRYQRSRETRERLALAAMKLFRKEGFASVTVGDICEAAGVSRSSYYFHFDTKEALLGEFDAMTARRATEELRLQSSRPGSTLIDEVGVVVDGLARRAQRMPKDLLAVTMGRAMRGLPYVARLPDPSSDFGHALAVAFARAQERGELPAGEDPQEMAAAFAAMLMEGMLRWAHGTTAKDDLFEVLRWRARIFLAGVKAGPDSS